MANFFYQIGEFFSNIWWHVRRFFKNVWRWTLTILKWIGLVIGIAIFLCMLMVWAVIDWTVRWNPVSFIIWSFCTPRTMAESLAYRQQGNTMFDMVMSIWPVIRFKTCAWHTYLIPMFLRKWYILENTDFFSEKQQVSAYRSFRSKSNKTRMLENMSREARGSFYSYATMEEKAHLLTYKEKYTYNEVKEYGPEEIGVLLYEQEEWILNLYFSQTPSQVIINKLISVSYYGNPLAPDYLGKVIFRDGMSAETLKRVMEMKDGHIKETLLKINLARGQKNLIREAGEGEGLDELKKFMEETPEIFKSAEKEMSVEVMKVFYETGHHLHEENILYFVSGSDDEYRKLIFTYEKELSDIVMAYIKADSHIYRLYLRTVKSEPEQE